MEHAVRRKILSVNPLPKGRGSVPHASRHVDPRRLLNRHQTAGMLDWSGHRVRMGRCYRALFAMLYYAGLRPEEAVALRGRDVSLPADGWGELHVRTANPEVGGRWTDDGKAHKQRCLKGRPVGAMRRVPLHPELVAMQRDLIENYGLGRGDLLFAGERGGLLAGSVYRRVWGKARKAVLPEPEYESLTGRRVADLRDTCLTMWLNNGVPPAQVAEWADTSVAVLFAAYATCISGQARELLPRIEVAQVLRGLHTAA
jgi:integrase